MLNFIIKKSNDKLSLYWSQYKMWESELNKKVQNNTDNQEYFLLIDQNKLDYAINSKNESDINLWESYFDPDLLYFEKELPNILKQLPPKELIQEELSYKWMPDYIDIKIKLPRIGKSK